jgi:hypothetical protein
MIYVRRDHEARINDQAEADGYALSTQIDGARIPFFFSRMRYYSLISMGGGLTEGGLSLTFRMVFKAILMFSALLQH